jgi:hypothetical protein
VGDRLGQPQFWGFGGILAEFEIPSAKKIHQSRKDARINGITHPNFHLVIFNYIHDWLSAHNQGDKKDQTAIPIMQQQSMYSFQKRSQTKPDQVFNHGRRIS